jgi:hypothetical protein
LQAPQGLHDDCVVALGLAATGIGAQVGYAESPFA